MQHFVQIWGRLARKDRPYIGFVSSKPTLSPTLPHPPVTCALTYSLPKMTAIQSVVLLGGSPGRPELVPVLIGTDVRVNVPNLTRYTTNVEQTLRRHSQKDVRWVA